MEEEQKTVYSVLLKTEGGTVSHLCKEHHPCAYPVLLLCC